MAGLTGLMDLGRDALAAQSFGLTVTGQNISNVNTPGYVRRQALLQNQVAATFGGVEATGLRRMQDQFINARYYEASGFYGSATARDDALGVVEGIFDDLNGTGLGTTLGALFQSFTALSANPTDPTTRAQVLAAAQDFVSQVQNASGALSSLRQDLFSQAQGTASEINELVSKIAVLDQQILAQKAAGDEPADLQDQQGRLLEQLSQLVDVHSFTDGSGRLVIQSSGTTLLEGGQASSLAVSTALSGSLVVSVVRPGGATTEITKNLQGGRLAGLVQARDVDVVQVSGQLDQLVYDVATEVNAQHVLGFGLDGFGGRALFAVPALANAAATIEIDPALAGHPERLAASEAAGMIPAGAGNAVKLAALSSKALTGGGTRTALQGYSDIVGDVASRKAAASREAEVREAMQSQVRTMRDSVSGVSMDEEMVSLSKFQRAFEAASKLIKTADELLASLIQDLGR